MNDLIHHDGEQVQSFESKEYNVHYIVVQQWIYNC